jgi:hypothetical protein
LTEYKVEHAAAVVDERPLAKINIVSSIKARPVVSTLSGHNGFQLKLGSSSVRFERGLAVC